MANNYSDSTGENPIPQISQTSYTPLVHTTENLLRTNMPRRAVEGSMLLNDVIREFQQHVENRGISFSNILNRPSTSEFASGNINHNQSDDSVVINLENVVSNRPNLTNPDIGHSNYQAAALLNAVATNNNVENNAGETPANETIHNVREIQQSLEIFQKYLPFLLILIAKGLYDHCEGIFDLIILFVTFLHTNSVVKREATAQARRSFTKLLVALFYILVCFSFIAYVFEDEKLYLNVIFMPPYKQPTTVWSLLWTAGITDFILKLITILFKICLTMLPTWVIPFQRRGKVYLFIESVSQLYRSLATIQPWLYYLLESYQGAEKIVGVFLSAAYMVSKGTDLMCRIRLFKTAILKVLQNVALGSFPSKDQIQTAGNHCPICHDEYNTPILLQCRHIFCESCVSTWFDREQTCPLCRAKIVDDPSWRDGSTTFFIQLF